MPAVSADKRVVSSVHGLKKAVPDPASELARSKKLAASRSRDELFALYARAALGEDTASYRERRVVLRALCRSFGRGVTVGPGFGFKHPETFEIGDGVFLGAQAFLQGRFDGLCRIGSFSWLGPQSYFDARDLVLGEYVGWGPGAKVVGSQHSGRPVDVPIITTDLEIKPVRVGDWCDIGCNAVILPGVTIGKGAVIGAGAVVTKDVPAFTVSAGVPARTLRARNK